MRPLSSLCQSLERVVVDESPIAFMNQWDSKTKVIYDGVCQQLRSTIQLHKPLLRVKSRHRQERQIDLSYGSFYKSLDRTALQQQPLHRSLFLDLVKHKAAPRSRMELFKRQRHGCKARTESSLVFNPETIRSHRPTVSLATQMSLSECHRPQQLSVLRDSTNTRLTLHKPSIDKIRHTLTSIYLTRSQDMRNSVEISNPYGLSTKIENYPRKNALLGKPKPTKIKNTKYLAINLKK